ncbi:hypothetical protein EDD86DRAFT_13170 [Gorgonomyces haynaldii]|nr:hypothetical protein EDD86DRAFT_13170 [Gorgonomyces haynaldii]
MYFLTGRRPSGDGQTPQRKDSSGSVTSFVGTATRLLSMESRESVQEDDEIEYIQARHREDIKVWKNLYQEVVDRLEQEKRKSKPTTDSQDFVSMAWLQGELNILLNHPVVSSAVLRKDSMTQMHFHDFESTVADEHTEVDMLSNHSHSDFVKLEDKMKAMREELAALKKENAALKKVSKTEMVNTWLQNSDTLQQSDLTLAWMQASLEVERWERQESLSQTNQHDIVNHWLQATNMILQDEMLSLKESHFQRDIESHWLQATNMILQDKLHSDNAVQEQSVIENHWLQASMMILADEARSKEESLFQRDVESHWLQATNMILQDKMECAIESRFQRDIESHWLQATNMILKDQIDSENTQRDQSVIENHWLQASMMIVADETRSKEESLFQRDIESHWQQATNAILNHYIDTETSMQDQSVIENHWLQACMMIANEKMEHVQTTVAQKDIENHWLQASVAILNERKEPVRLGLAAETPKPEPLQRVRDMDKRISHLSIASSATEPMSPRTEQDFSEWDNTSLISVYADDISFENKEHAAIQSIVWDSQTVVENAWLQAEIGIINHKMQSMHNESKQLMTDYQLMENDMIMAQTIRPRQNIQTIRQRSHMDSQEFLVNQWLQGALVIANAQSTSLSMQSDLELAWIQGELGIKNAQLCEIQEKHDSLSVNYQLMETEMLMAKTVSRRRRTKSVHVPEDKSEQMYIQQQWEFAATMIANCNLDLMQDQVNQMYLQQAWLQGAAVIESGKRQAEHDEESTRLKTSAEALKLQLAMNEEEFKSKVTKMNTKFKQERRTLEDVIIMAWNRVRELEAK